MNKAYNISDMNYTAFTDFPALLSQHVWSPDETGPFDTLSNLTWFISNIIWWDRPFAPATEKRVININQEVLI